MTVETTTTIELGDIQAIEFECKNCHGIVKWPIKSFKQPPTECLCDHRKQWMSVGGDTYAAIVRLTELIRRFGAVENEPFLMKFAVSGVSASGRASGDKG